MLALMLRLSYVAQARTPSSVLASVLALIAAGALSIGCTTAPGESEPEIVLEPWAKSFQGAVQPESLASGPTGQVLFGGSFSYAANFGGGLLLAEPNGSVFLAHLGADGEHLFSGSTGANDVLREVAIGPQGNLYASGSFDGVINFGSGKLEGSRDGYLTAFTSDGASDFSLAVGADNNDSLNHVAATPSGDVIVTGSITDDVDIGGGAPSQVETQLQGVIAAYDSEGRYQWETRIDAYYTDDLEVEVDPAGEIVVYGSTYDSVTLGDKLVAPGTFVAKLSSTGETSWIVSVTADDSAPQPRDLTTGPDGSVYVSGFYYGAMSFGGFAAPHAPERNLFLAKLSPAGEVEYVHAFQASQNGASPEIAVAPSGDLFVGISTYDTIDFGGGPLGGADSTYDAVIARFTPAGEHVRSMALEGTGMEYVRDVAVDPTGKLVVLGAFSSVLDIGETRLLVSDGENNVFVTRMEF